MFTMVIKADPAYRDVSQRLDNARRQQQLAGWQAEARRLYQAQEWAAVVKIGERLHILDPAAADPDGLVSSARAQLASAEQAVQIASQYSSGLRLLDVGNWRQAIEVLERLDPTYRDTAALLARARRELPDPPASPPPSPTIIQRPTAVQSLRHRKAVTAVAFSPDGHRLATASDDHTVRIWDTASGQECLSVTHKGVRPNARGRPANVHGRAVAFSPDGRWLATASDDETARIWDVTSGQHLVAMPHNNVVVGVVFSPDGHRLATASDDKTVRVCDAISGRQLAAVTHEDSVQALPVEERTSWRSQLAWVTRKGCVQGVAFSPDGRRLATAGTDMTARIWALSDDE